jgi:hypothetical protein
MTAVWAAVARRTGADARQGTATGILLCLPAFPSPQGPSSPLGLRIKILVIGLAGSGKTQLIRSLLGGPLAGERVQGF